jgi:hypothetical protein
MEGDVIIIIYGTYMPLVLRPADGGCFILIGEAYVHGIMDSEFLRSRLSDELFNLC